MHKQIQFRIKGMNRDLSVAAFNPEYAYENMNLRIFSTDSNTTASLSNEKGTKLVNVIDTDGNELNIEGSALGYAVIDDCLILFTTGTGKDIAGHDAKIDRIYKITFTGNTAKGELKYAKDLNFNTEYPIETLAYYEAEGIRKVYWTDGINQPRVINIDEDYYKIVASQDGNKIVYKDNDTFDFVRKLDFSDTIEVYKSETYKGTFPSGVIQYAFTYYSSYGQETNIAYVSPLFYLAHEDRGGSPVDKVNNAFEIKIESSNEKYDYIRIYSIVRASVNTTPYTKRVVDIKIKDIQGKGNNGYIFVDDGIIGDTVDPTELLYKGGEEITALTMSQKDNTLFLGNIKVNRKSFSDIKIEGKDIQSYINSIEEISKKVEFKDKHIEAEEPKEYYPYKIQLSGSSQDIKTFKYLEYYRFGFQAQHNTGKWSEPIWLGDYQNTKPITSTYNDDSDINLTKASITFNTSSKEYKELFQALKEAGYLRIRPVIVYPSFNDRECICQGIVCPTIYNVGDRLDNSPFVQSSWFARPNAPFAVGEADVTSFKGTGKSIFSKAGVMSNISVNVGTEEEPIKGYVTDKGSWSEFRHNYPIPNSGERNAEIQCLFNGPTSPVITEDNWKENYKEWFFIDQSIITLHSPDLEFDEKVKTSNLSSYKFRIVGIVPITSFNSDIDIQTSTPPLTINESTEVAKGFYKKPSSARNNFNDESYFGWRGINTGTYWIDTLVNSDSGTTHDHYSFKYEVGYAIYPWHREGSLNNTKDAKNNYKSSLLKEKKMINSKFSYKSIYLEKSWKPTNGISGIGLWDSNEISVIKIPSQNKGSEDISYYGNINKVLSCPSFLSKNDKLKGYPIIVSSAGLFYEGTPSSSDIEIGHNTIYNYPYISSLDKDGYYNYKELLGEWDSNIPSTGLDPVSIKYKSTTHAVIAFNNNLNKQIILPRISNINEGNSNISPFWDNTLTGVTQDLIDTPFINLPYGYLYLGEIYNDSIVNRFGGNTPDALANNQWLPCGEPVNLTYNDSTLKSKITIEWTEGDTYYQRYDHIKTYPFTTEDTNQVTDIISFMCETRVNIDGRYDRNRGNLNLAINPSNFNIINDVYSQDNNFFVYRALNTDRINPSVFPSTLTWTKTKTAGELVDNWTNVTLASTLELDGNKGPITSINRFNNNLIAFQENAFSQILYNENMQISSSEGVPIEIANSGKVNGKRYISDTIGCFNKWSICETPRGIYFIDDNSKDIYVFNGQIDNISDRLGFSSWINNTATRKVWNPVDFKNIVTYYDKINNDVFFITKEECLAFSEKLGTFTSFYSYENSPYFFNVLDKGIWVHNNKLWLHNKGEYNSFFDEDGDKYREFYTTIIANPDMNKDKTFNTLEFRSDTWDKDNNLLDEETFNKLEVWNEYQRGCTILNYNKVGVTNLKKKYRIWRANIPRDNSNMRDRMRNPWLYLKLTKYNDDSNKTILHDMVITYFE